jgi:hypothetical protein
MKKAKPLVASFGMLFLACFVSPIQARTKWERSVDTFTVEMPRDTFYSAFQRWREKVNARQLPCTAPECDTLPLFYSTGMFKTGLFVKSEVVDSNHLKMYLTHAWLRGNSEPALYRIPNVTYTLEQELGAGNNKGVIVSEKSYWAFVGLTLLNSGIGMMYASYKSPFSKENIPFNILYTAMDAALTAGLFVNDRNVRTFSGVFLPAAKLAVGLRVIFVREHNKYARTGYKFLLGR